MTGLQIWDLAMESKWVINFEDIVYLIISAGLFCLIISWVLSVLLINKNSFNYELLTNPSSSSISESLPQKAMKSDAPPIASQQSANSLNIHPLEVMSVHEQTNIPPPSSQSSCTKADC